MQVPRETSQEVTHPKTTTNQERLTVQSTLMVVCSTVTLVATTTCFSILYLSVLGETLVQIGATLISTQLFLSILIMKTQFHYG